MSEKGQIMLTADDGSQEAFFVLEKADIAGVSYLLVEDSDEEEADALILKEIEQGDEITYELVEDEKELRIIGKYFEELLEDVEIEME
ncbi:MAG: DUF1292 domain-containing protein [Eubacterium sp.]|nr:DUF1292 domain-containing protein [Eubacterium sp.]